MPIGKWLYVALLWVVGKWWCYERWGNNVGDGKKGDEERERKREKEKERDMIGEGMIIGNDLDSDAISSHHDEWRWRQHVEWQCGCYGGGGGGCGEKREKKKRKKERKLFAYS